MSGSDTSRQRLMRETEALVEVRSAIELVRGGQPCAAVSALLAARSELSTPLL